MSSNEYTIERLPSGVNVIMSADLYDGLYLNFTETQYFSFNNFINAGLYFPQIAQFIAVVVSILRGETEWYQIILSNILSGSVFTLFWFMLRLYKAPGLAFICCLIGGNVFRLFLHFIPLGIISFFVVKDWKVLLFCALGGAIASIIKTVLYGKLSSMKYHNEIVKYVGDFKYKR